MMKMRRKFEPPFKCRKTQELKLSPALQNSTTFSRLREQHIALMMTGLDDLIQRGTRAKSYTLPGTIPTPLIIVPMKPGTWVTGKGTRNEKKSFWAEDGHGRGSFIGHIGWADRGGRKDFDPMPGEFYRIAGYTLGYFKPEPGSVSPLQLQLTSETSITHLKWEHHEWAKKINKMVTFRPLATGMSTDLDNFVDIRARVTNYMMDEDPWQQPIIRLEAENSLGEAGISRRIIIESRYLNRSGIDNYEERAKELIGKTVQIPNARILQTVDRKYGKEEWKNNRMRETGLLVYKPFPGIYAEGEEDSEDETDDNVENGSENEDGSKNSGSENDDSGSEKDGFDKFKSDNKGEKKKNITNTNMTKRPGYSVL